MTDDQLQALLQEMRKDPEFVSYLMGLAPGSPLKAAIHDYARMLWLRARFAQKEADDHQAVMNLMDAHGFQDSDELIDAWQRGDVELSATDLEALVRWGVISPVPES